MDLKHRRRFLSLARVIQLFADKQIQRRVQRVGVHECLDGLGSPDRVVFWGRRRRVQRPELEKVTGESALHLLHQRELVVHDADRGEFRPRSLPRARQVTISFSLAAEPAHVAVVAHARNGLKTGRLASMVDGFLQVLDGFRDAVLGPGGSLEDFEGVGDGQVVLFGVGIPSIFQTQLDCIDNLGSVLRRPGLQTVDGVPSGGEE
mmetsp:Transcript_10295/g.34075  ORF Transcript_10295/g.34075 Transcript_10295/m.34075 type:complete len:205 (-) Transcript_10295:1066-1680(-)